MINTAKQLFELVCTLLFLTAILPTILTCIVLEKLGYTPDPEDAPSWPLTLSGVLSVLWIMFLLGFV